MTAPLHSALRARYAAHWLSFKLRHLLRPFVSSAAASSTCRASFSFHRWGFTFFIPGQPLVRCARRILVSWRVFADGPCNFATYAYLTSAGDGL